MLLPLRLHLSCCWKPFCSELTACLPRVSACPAVRNRRRVTRTGEDITRVGWGIQVARMEEAADRMQREDGVSCEIIDLQTIVPW